MVSNAILNDLLVILSLTVLSVTLIFKVGADPKFVLLFLFSAVFIRGLGRGMPTRSRHLVRNIFRWLLPLASLLILYLKHTANGVKPEDIFMFFGMFILAEFLPYLVFTGTAVPGYVKNADAIVMTNFACVITDIVLATGIKAYLILLAIGVSLFLGWSASRKSGATGFERRSGSKGARAISISRYIFPILAFALLVAFTPEPLKGVMSGIVVIVFIVAAFMYMLGLGKK